MPWNWAEARRESIGLRVDLTCSEDESADTASLTLNFAHGAKKHIKSNGTLGPRSINRIKFLLKFTYNRRFAVKIEIFSFNHMFMLLKLTIQDVKKGM